MIGKTCGLSVTTPLVGSHSNYAFVFNSLATRFQASEGVPRTMRTFTPWLARPSLTDNDIGSAWWHVRAGFVKTESAFREKVQAVQPAGSDSLAMKGASTGRDQKYRVTPSSFSTLYAVVPPPTLQM